MVLWECCPVLQVKLSALTELLTLGHEHQPSWLYFSTPSVTFCGMPSFHAVVFPVHPTLRMRSPSTIQIPWPAVSSFAVTTHHLMDRCLPKKYSHSWHRFLQAECQGIILSVLPLCHPCFSLALSCISRKLSSSWLHPMYPFFGSCLFPSVYHHPKLRFVSRTCLPDTSWASSRNTGEENGEKKPMETDCFPLSYGMMACCIHDPLLVHLHTRAGVSIYKQRNWGQKAGLIYQMSKAGVEIGEILQISCLVYIHSIL